MKIEILNNTPEQAEANDFSSSVAIIIDGECVARLRDGGEPEDNSLSRDWNDVYTIIDLMKKVADAKDSGIFVDFVKRSFTDAEYERWG